MDDLRIVAAKVVEDDLLVLTFSDGRIAAFTLLEIRSLAERNDAFTLAQTLSAIDDSLA